MKLENKSIKQLKKQCWDLLSKLIRLENPVCEICEDRKSFECHHVIPKARGNAVYLLRANIIAVCRGCHLMWHSRFSPKEKDIIILKTKGLKFNEVEMAKNNIVKFKHKYLIETIKNYQKQLKEIE